MNELRQNSVRYNIIHNMMTMMMVQTMMMTVMMMIPFQRDQCYRDTTPSNLIASVTVCSVPPPPLHSSYVNYSLPNHLASIGRALQHPLTNQRHIADLTMLIKHCDLRAPPSIGRALQHPLTNQRRIADLAMLTKHCDLRAPP